MMIDLKHLSYIELSAKCKIYRKKAKESKVRSVRFNFYKDLLVEIDKELKYRNFLIGTRYPSGGSYERNN